MVSSLVLLPCAGLRKAVQEAMAVADEARDEIDVVVTCHDAFGKGHIKKCNLSPDAFIQLAFQIAYYKARTAGEGGVGCVLTR